MSEAEKISEALKRIIKNRHEDGGPCEIGVGCCYCSECVAAAALPLAEKLEGNLAMAEAALQKAGQHAKNMQQERDSLRAELGHAKQTIAYGDTVLRERNEFRSDLEEERKESHRSKSDLRAQVEQLKSEISECEQILNPGPIERGGDLKQMVQLAIQSIDTLQEWRRELQKEVEQLKADKALWLKTLGDLLKESQ